MPLAQYPVCITPISYHNVKPLSASCLEDLGSHPNNSSDNLNVAARDVFVQ